MQVHSRCNYGLLCKSPRNGMAGARGRLRPTRLTILCQLLLCVGSVLASAFPASDSISSSVDNRLPKTKDHVLPTGAARLRDARPTIPGSPADERGKLDLRSPVFIENQGQFDERVRFRVVGNGASLWLQETTFFRNCHKLNRKSPSSAN
jgi:hypothetical protein